MHLKETNPKDTVGSKKWSMSNVPVAVLAEASLGMMEGNLKYGANNWRALGVAASVYYNAASRHLMRWWAGEDTDPDSGISHLSKVISCLLVLRDAQIHGKMTDDRPPLTDFDNMQLNKKAAELVEKYGHIQPKHYTILNWKEGGIA